jgi:hypothetical protein
MPDIDVSVSATIKMQTTTSFESREDIQGSTASQQ